MAKAAAIDAWRPAVLQWGESVRREAKAMAMVSISTLCPHIERSFAREWRDWFAALPVKPKAVKVFTQEAAAWIKSLAPEVMTVLRRYVPDQSAYLSEGAAGGRRFVQEIASLEGVDVLEFLNEEGATPEHNEAALGFVEECARRGVRPCLFNFSVGSPEVLENGLLSDRWLRIVAPAAQAALDAGGYLGYHSYFPARWLEGAEWLAFRNALRIDPLLRMLLRPGTAIRWLHTEAGFDSIAAASGPSGPWRKLVRDGVLSYEAVKEIYRAYDAACRAHGIEAAFIFTFWGFDSWRDYDHAPDLIDFFAAHWAAHPKSAPRRARVAGTGGLGLRLRAAPAMDAPVLGVLPEGAVVERAEPAGAWARVPLDRVVLGGGAEALSPSGGRYGYCAIQYLRWD